MKMTYVAPFGETNEVFPFSYTVPSPPTALMVETIHAEEFTVTWTAPDSEMFTGYKMTISEGENVKTETPAKGATSVKIIGLTSGTKYSVDIVTVNNQDESSVLTETAYTCELCIVFFVCLKNIIHVDNWQPNLGDLKVIPTLSGFLYYIFIGLC